MNPEVEEFEENEACKGDTGESAPTPQFLQFALILKQILSNLPIADLLTCSLVCKAWNYESRCVLRDRRILVATIDGDDLCVKFKEFDNFLSTLTVVPFTGLRVRLTDDSKYPQCVGSQNLEEFYPSILKMNLKYLHVDWMSIYEPSQPCPAIFLLRKFFKLGLLENVDIKRLPYWLDLYSLDVIENLDLPKLKTLKLYEDGVREDVAPDEVDVRLVEAAPNLKELDLEIFCDDEGFLPADKLKCITKLEFSPHDMSDLDFLEKIALASAKIQKLSIYISPEMNLDRTWRILKLLLESSKNSLCVLNTDLVVGLKLMKTQVPLQGLEKLEIGLHYDWTQSQLALVPLLGNIDFARLFPSLKSLKLDPRRQIDRQHLELFFTESELDPRHQFTIKYTGGLALRAFCIGEVLPTMAANFPNITSFTGNTGRHPPPYTLLWQLWPKLERLVIVEFGTYDKHDTRCLTPFLNLDAEFCGISPEEAEELQTKDEEFLKNIHIVPIKPAIMGLQNLKKFRLRIYADREENFPVDDNDLFLLSKVTGCVAFRRMSGRVDLRMEVSKRTMMEPMTEFTHVKRYMNVVNKTFEL